MKFFNSDKSGFLSFVAKRMKALFALFFIIAGVQTLSAALVKGSWDGWQNHDLIRVAGNEYYVDIVMTNATTDEFGIDFNGSFYSLSDYTITNWCSSQKFYTNNSNCKFTHNKGTYRFRVRDDGNEKTLTITGIIVTIDEPVKNANGTYTITGRFTNANTIEQQTPTAYQIVIKYGTTTDYENATLSGDGSSFSVTKSFTPGVPYTCFARVIDNKVGANDSKSITFTPGQDPTPSFTDLYLRGEQMGWGAQSSDEWKQTSVSSDGNVYTWNWTSDPKTINGNFKIAALPADGSWDGDNNFGPKDNDVTLSFENGVATVTVWSDGGSKNINTTERVSMIVLDKAKLTATFYTTEQPTPVFEATITATPGTGNVTLSSTLTESLAGTDLTSATCQFQYKAADAAEGTEYSDLDASVAYSTEGATRTATLSQSMAAGSYVFRAVWTYSEAEVANAVTGTVAIGDAGVTYPVTPVMEHFSVEWTPVYNPADRTVTFTAQISATEDAGFVMGQITGLVAYIIVNGNSTQATVEYVAGSTENTATATVTYQNASIDDVLEYSMSLTTGSNGIVSGVGGIEIAGGSYTVIEPEAQNSTLILRGEMNDWAYEGIDDKYVGKTYDGGTTVFWDWSESPVEFAFSSDAGSTFKIDDTTDGEWGEGQWGYKAGNDFWIVQDLISSDGTVTITELENHVNASFLLFAEAICPVTVTRMELNTATRTLTIDCEITVPQKDLWFRSEIVEGGWGDGISDPIGSGVSPKYKGQTTDGKIYIWDWSGSNAVTVDSGVEFKFGEYTGSSSWGNSGYAPNGQASVTSADFGKEISVQVAAGNFSAGEKITITKITLDTETLKLVLEGEKFTERFPVTVNTVNGEAGGTVTTEPADIGNMAIGETVTVTATANEGYVALFEATRGCVMTDGSADNIKVFEITEANPVITVTFQVQCQTVETGFTISGQFNKGVTDGGGLYEGTAVESGDADPKDGYWSDGARFIQLTANSVPANYFEWVCTGYAIDGVDQETVPEIAWTDQYKTSARAELSLPGTYTFVCNAKCNLGDDWTQSDTLTITAPAPEMGFNGNIVTNHDWGNPEWAGQTDGGYMQRVKGSLVWKSNGFTVDGFGDNEAYHFVIEQRYKLLGCVTNEGWTEHNECGESGESEKDNKINRSNLSFTNVAFNDNKQGYNFIAINNSGWTSGVNGTKLQLVVTMIGWDSYTVALEEVSQECTTPADNFAISARLNQGSGEPFEGNLVASGSNTATGGYFADGFRTVTLTTTQVADTYEWKLVGYAIDGNAQATADLSTLATITNGNAQTATALLSLPGDYTFQCTAACTDGTPVNSATVTISTYPEMGFDGPIGTPANLTTENNGWNHAWAAEENNGLLERQSGTLTWTNTFTYQNVNNLTDFVVIQRYKLGCVATPKGYEDRPAYLGWAGHDECPGQSIVNSGNKINASANISFQGYAVSSNPGEQNMNFIASGEKVSSWISGETQLTLTVTMTGWDSYTVELSKKQEQIFANYSSNDETMGTVTMKVGDTYIANGVDITAYIGQQVTLTASPAQGYKVASWKINDKETESDRTTISPTLSGDGLIVVVTFERDCYAGVAYDLTGGGFICANGGSTELSLNTLNNVKYQLYQDGEKYGDPVQGNGEAAKWTISKEGTYTAKAYDSRHEECEEQAMDMNGSADVTSVEAPEISVNPGANVHLTVLQARSFTADVPVDWSITDVTGSGGYCEGNGYMISSRTDTSLVAKFLCIGTAKITATMKDPNQNCKAEVTVHQNGAETEVCAPEPEDVQ